MKYLSLLFISFAGFLNAQELTPKTELKIHLTNMSHYLSGPCQSPEEIRMKNQNSVVHFLRFESCQEDNTKLKGFVYAVVVIDDTFYSVSLESANHYFWDDDYFLNYYKRFNQEERSSLQAHNLALNRSYYFNEREKIRLEEEKRRKEEEERIKAEEERKKREDEQMAMMRAQQLANAYAKAKTDSLMNDSLKQELIFFTELLKENESRVKNKIQQGKNNGGILITQFDFTTSDYGVVDLTLGIQNVGKKRIKYATFKLQPLNSVEDPVENISSFKGIGFIEPGEEGTWEFESAWYSDVIEYLILKSVTLIYEDGTSKVVSNIGDIRIDSDEDLLRDIHDFNETIIHSFGSLNLLEYTGSSKGLVGALILSVTDGKSRSIVMDEMETINMMNNLAQIIERLKRNAYGRIGDFETTPYSTNMYVYFKDGYALLSLQECENLLSKLKTIYPIEK